MIIAIACHGNTMEDKIDIRFGRCSFFAFYDTETKNINFIENPNKEAESRAGFAAVHLIISYGANKVIAGDFGRKIKPLMDRYHIQMITLCEEKTVGDIISILSK